MSRPARTRSRSPTADSVRIAVRVKPRARHTQVLGVREGVLEVAVAAPPVEGEANRELVAVVARHFGLPKTSVSILAGASGRHKWIGLSGIDPQRVTARLGGAKSQ